jgi:diguanylate cyclase (GGDEF)-like protein/PAS domain S-box-containing protein
MTERAQLFEATLECVPEGVALLDAQCQIVFWNRAAEVITGLKGMDIIGRPTPENLKPLLDWCGSGEELGLQPTPHPGRGFLVHARHKLGQDVPVMARILILRDDLGRRIGTGILFHPAESLEALPQGEVGDDEGVEGSQAELKDRLNSLFDDFTQGGPAFGVLWITVDQAHDLRRTHGAGAVESMLAKVERALAQGLRAAENLGRWGDDEFLVISHERTAAMLAVHAQALAGLARTADFRWWGDRVQLTVSIGAAQTEPGVTLVNLLDMAKAAMFTSFHAGGNRITSAQGGDACLPS